MDHNKIRSELLKQNCDWFIVKVNMPSASHFGGVWERQIRTVRNVMSALLEKNGGQLDDEALRTFLCEVEATVNSCPLTVDNVNDPNSLDPLTPSHLLTMKSSSTRKVSVSRPLLQKALEKDAALSKLVLVQLEERVFTCPSRMSEVDLP